MKFNIYDYQNKPTKVDTGKRPIDYIEVSVISGDEVIEVHYSKGCSHGLIKRFDSSDTRWDGFLDAEYRVTNKNLEDWIKKETVGGDIAYSRIPD